MSAAANQIRESHRGKNVAFMLKLKWDIREGAEPEFRTNQEKLCAAMQEHPGVISCHAEYPSANVSEWKDIYATDAAFKAHLANEKSKAPLGALVDACDQITCRCFGDAPDDESQKILEGFGTTYHDLSAQVFVLHPGADRESTV